MSVVFLEQIRQDRAEHQALVKSDTQRLMEGSISYGIALAIDAYTATMALRGSDHRLQLVIERFLLRRGLSRSRQSWRKEYGKDQGLVLAKLAAPIVRAAFWTKLDELHPLVCESHGKQVPLLRGWADRYWISA